MGQTGTYLLSFGLWIVSSALAILELLVTYRVLGGIFALAAGDMWVRSALDKFSLVILAVVGLAFVFVCEDYYRKGVEERELWQRFRRVAGAQAVLFLLLSAGVLLL